MAPKVCTAPPFFLASFFLLPGSISAELPSVHGRNTLESAVDRPRSIVRSSVLAADLLAGRKDLRKIRKISFVFVF